MKTKHLRPKAIYQDTARVGRRIITMIADGYVFYTVVRQARSRLATPLGVSGHCKVHHFVDWADKEVEQ